MPGFRLSSMGADFKAMVEMSKRPGSPALLGHDSISAVLPSRSALLTADHRSSRLFLPG